MTGNLYARAGLMKPAVSALGASAALLGFAACRPDRAPAALLAGACVFLLSAGACTLNNYQDRDFDGLAERTRRRALPAGRLAPRQALIQAALLLGAGLAGLFFCTASPLAFLAGLLAVLLYNAVYTPLKKKTLAALIPGVLCGTLPPLVGWLAAGGELSSTRLFYLMALFGVWQLPHLWLLALANGGSENRPAPSFLDSLTPRQLRRLVLTWTAAFAFLTLFLKVFGFIGGGLPAVLLVLNAFALPAAFALGFRKPWDAGRSRYFFRCLNGSLLGLTLLAAADSLYR